MTACLRHILASGASRLPPGSTFGCGLNDGVVGPLMEMKAEEIKVKS
jgi:hypothetical protein